MKFTLEVGGTTLNFRDLTLVLTPHIQGLQVEFNIYRKPTFTGVSIHQDSYHAQSHKWAVINRFISIPLSTKAGHMDIQTLKQIAI